MGRACGLVEGVCAARWCGLLCLQGLIRLVVCVGAAEGGVGAHGARERDSVGRWCGHYALRCTCLWRSAPLARNETARGAAALCPQLGRGGAPAAHAPGWRPAWLAGIRCRRRPLCAALAAAAARATLYNPFTCASCHAAAAPLVSLEVAAACSSMPGGWLSAEPQLSAPCYRRHQPWHLYMCV